MAMDRTALVLGATGGIGGEVARLLLARGWSVRALHRDPTALSKSQAASGLVWVQGNAMSASDVASAAAGVSVIVHAVNPPGYRNWGELVLPMLDNTIAAARANGARIVLPGTIYNFGPDAFPDLAGELAPKRRHRQGRHPRRNGAAAARRDIGGREGSDRPRRRFLRTEGGQQLVLAGAGQARPAGRRDYLSRPPGIGHQWAYLPDVAGTMVRLLETPSMLEPFATFHMQGHWDADGTAMIDAIRKAVGNPNLKVRPMPWWLMRLLSPFVPLFRELAEMRYLWNVPVRMDNARLTAALGTEPHTPLDVAVRKTLIGLGGLTDDRASGS